jgi:TIR domain
MGVMGGSSSATTKQIFISYRRQETSHLAGRLYDRLADRFGEDHVFMDVDSIEPGIDFSEAIQQAVGSSEVLLALIGRDWLKATDEDGRRRLDDPDDIVRLEIEAALERDIRVIPVLAEGATMPKRQDLPDSLARLARRNAVRLSHESFRHETAHLVEVLARLVNQPPEPRREAQPGQTPRVQGDTQPSPPERQQPSPPPSSATPMEKGDEQAFHLAMLSIYRRAKRDLGYNASRFLQMLDQGGLPAARQLLHAPGVSDGFRTLWEHKRLDLTVEAHVLKPEFQHLFTPQELDIARSRLRDYGYEVPT